MPKPKKITPKYKKYYHSVQLVKTTLQLSQTKTGAHRRLAQTLSGSGKKSKKKRKEQNLPDREVKKI